MDDPLGSSVSSLSAQTLSDKVTALVRVFAPYTTEHKLVRVGGDNDGGYLIPDDLEGIAADFPPAVGRVA